MSDFLRWRKWMLAALAATASGGALAFAACIPDLDGSTPDAAGPMPDSTSTTPVSQGFCGDGFIDLVAGEQCDPGGESNTMCSDDCQMLCPAVAAPGNPQPKAFIDQSIAGHGGNNHCYFEVQVPVDAGGPKTMHDTAETLCASQSPPAHLVTFASEEEWDFVATAFKFDETWVGLHRNAGTEPYQADFPEEPGWWTDCAGCYAHEQDGAVELPRTPLADGAVPAPTTCVNGSDDPDASWVEQSCTSTSKAVVSHVVCEREPHGTLISRCNGVLCFRLVYTQNEKSYFFVPGSADAGDAVSQCASLGGRLVVLETRDEREQMWHELFKVYPPPTTLWIGLSQDDAGDWVWEDGTKANAPDAYPPPWAANEPSMNAGRAVAVSTYPEGYDPSTELAQANGTVTTAQFVCEVSPDAGP